MVWWMKPSGGPDKVGGVSPVSVGPIACRNRSGATIVKGEAVQLAFTPGAATEIATNDDNSYIPGASNDTVWHTVIDPRSNTAQGSSIHRGLVVGVCTDESVADNAIGRFQFFGLTEAFCVKLSSDHMAPGDPLTVTVTNNFTGTLGSNVCVVGMYLDAQTNLTNRKLRRVFLHNGAIPQPAGITALG